MRPLKLTMSAFGSYLNKTEIAFERFGASGLYMVSGITGAGKTMIFDAITYALFGEASGDSRDIGGMRSTNATPETETFVEFTFLSKGKKYTVRRSPEYKRKKQRGEGETTEKAKVCLTFYDGRVPIEKSSEVENLIINDIIGLTKQQFVQIEMIAQGEFRKVLNAKTDDRKKIFRQIFGTEKYERLQETIRLEMKSVEDEYKRLKSEALTTFGLLNTTCDASLDEKISVMKQNYAEVSEMEQLVSEVITFENAVCGSENEKKERVEQKISENNELIEKSKIQTDLHQMEKIKAGKELSRNALKENFEKITGWKFRFDELNRQLGEMKSRLAEYDALEQKIKDKNDTDRKIITLTEKISKGEKAVNDAVVEIESLENESVRLSGSEAELGRLSSDKKEKETEKQLLIKLANEIKALQDAEKNLHQAQNDYMKACEKAAAAKNDYEVKNKVYLDNQAGIIAAGLEEGRPCPVCGSQHHPSPASLPKKICTKEEVEKAKQLSDEASAAVTAASAEAATQKGVVETCRATVSQEIKNFFGECAVEAAVEKIKARFEELKRTVAELSEEIAAASAGFERKKQIDSSLPQKKELLKNYQKTLQQIVNERISAESNSKSLETDVKEMRTRLPYYNKREALCKVGEKESEAVSVQENITKADDEWRSFEKEMENLDGKITTLKEQLGTTEELDKERLEAQKEDLENEKRSCESSLRRIHAAIDKADDIAARLGQIRGTMAETEKKMQWIVPLFEVACGRNGGDKTDLETFIQMAYLDMVVEKANRRYLGLSNNQYMFRRSEVASDNRSDHGLDLDVFDYHLGQCRSVSGLSGGEAFLASLCLALGLSDQVQETAGGIRLDSLFIDEGFGSLDDESLNRAVNMLGELTDGNRLVGIISHVESLENAIGNKIIVTKDEASGSKAKISVENAGVKVSPDNRVKPV